MEFRKRTRAPAAPEFRKRTRAVTAPQSKRTRLAPEERYAPERIISLGEVDENTDPKDWKGWAGDYPDHPIVRSLGTYVGRIIAWYDSTGYLWHTSIRWAKDTKTHFFVGNYKNGAVAVEALGVSMDFKWVALGGNQFRLKIIYR